jgi:hypothetical protein
LSAERRVGILGEFREERDEIQRAHSNEQEDKDLGEADVRLIWRTDENHGRVGLCARNFITWV